jgi:hypothetical protein
MYLTKEQRQEIRLRFKKDIIPNAPDHSELLSHADAADERIEKLESQLAAKDEEIRKLREALQKATCPACFGTGKDPMSWKEEPCPQCSIADAALKGDK